MESKRKAEVERDVIDSITKSLVDKGLIIDSITKSLVDKGLIIEAGWTGFCMAVMPKDASEVQINEMRKAFFAGSQHLFASILNILDPGSEPTERDLKRMDLIDQELRNYVAQFKEEHLT